MYHSHLPKGDKTTARSAPGAAVPRSIYPGGLLGVIVACFVAAGLVGCRPGGPTEEPSSIGPQAARARAKPADRRSPGAQQVGASTQPTEPQPPATGDRVASPAIAAPVSDEDDLPPPAKPASDQVAAPPAKHMPAVVPTVSGPASGTPTGDSGAKTAPLAPGPGPNSRRTGDEDQTDKGEPLGPPLVDRPDQLTRLHPRYPVWVDKKRGILVTVGRVCQRRAPLELFACLKGSKEHESIIAIETTANVVHAGLLVLGAEPGRPVRFTPQFSPPSGTEIEVEVVWKDHAGRVRRARAQDWVHDVSAMYRLFDWVVPDEADEELDPRDQLEAWRQMEHPWVFAGSQFVKDQQRGRQYYAADMEGDLICVSNFPSAVLDVPIRSTDANASLLFACYTERIPPLGTPVTVILRPKLEQKE